MSSRLIGNGGWNLPTPTSGDLITTWGIIRHEVGPVTQFTDEVVWILEDHGSFSLKSPHLAISGFQSNHRVPWVDLIWFNGCLKKKTFLMYLDGVKGLS